MLYIIIYNIYNNIYMQYLDIVPILYLSRLYLPRASEAKNSVTSRSAENFIIVA